MGKISKPNPVKLFVGMLSEDIALFDELKTGLTELFGSIDLEGPVWPWEHTRYYEKEMGAGLKRKFIFFEKLISPEKITDIKLKTNELEQQYLNDAGGRRINLDPGYLDASKLVLVTTKNYSHRVYLDKSIYAEVTLIYSGDNFQPLPYTYNDYKSEEYLEIFRKARKMYKAVTKSEGRSWLGKT